MLSAPPPFPAAKGQASRGQKDRHEGAKGQARGGKRTGTRGQARGDRHARGQKDRHVQAACSGLLTPRRQPVGDMLVAGGLCRHGLLRHGASRSAGKVHRLLRVPPTGWRNVSGYPGAKIVPVLFPFSACPRPAGEMCLAIQGRRLCLSFSRGEGCACPFPVFFPVRRGAGQEGIQMAVRKLRSQVHWRFANWRVRCCVRRIAAARPIRPSRKSIASA